MQIISRKMSFVPRHRCWLDKGLRRASDAKHTEEYSKIDNIRIFFLVQKGTHAYVTSHKVLFGHDGIFCKQSVVDLTSATRCI